MQEPTSIGSEHLYQSQWWARLAAFSETRESPPPAANRREPEKKRASFSRALVSLLQGFHPNRERAATAGANIFRQA